MHCISKLLCRDLGKAGAFDKVVSCEMIEAVGHENLPAYFHAIGRALRPGGKAAIQVSLCPFLCYSNVQTPTALPRRDLTMLGIHEAC